nr:glycosyltransferase [Parvularcula mediterranea]
MIETLARPRRWLTLPQELLAIGRLIAARRFEEAIYVGLPIDPGSGSAHPQTPISITRKAARIAEAGKVPPTDGMATDQQRRLEDAARLAIAKSRDLPEARRQQSVGMRPALVVDTHIGVVRSGYTRRTQALRQALGDLGTTTAEISRDGVLDREVLRIDGSIAECRDVTSSNNLSAFTANLADEIEQAAIEMQASLLHAASNHALGFATLSAARRLGIPFVYELRGLWHETRAALRPSYRGTLGFTAQENAELEVAAAADAVLANGDGLAAWLSERNCDPDQVSIVHNGIDPTLFEDLENAQAVRQKFALGPEPIVAFAGSLTAYEGLEDVVRAMAKLQSKSQLVLAGDGPAGDAAERLARESGVKLHRTGMLPQAEAFAILAAADIVPIIRPDTPLTRYVAPLKPVEAMAAGAALIVSDLPALSSHTDEGRGVTVPPSDSEALAQAMDVLLSDKDRRLRIAQRGQAWAHEHRTWKQSALTIQSVYDTIL